MEFRVTLKLTKDQVHDPSRGTPPLPPFDEWKEKRRTLKKMTDAQRAVVNRKANSSRRNVRGVLRETR